MKQIWKQLKQGRRQVALHPFFTWINSEDVPLEQRFVFTPVMIDFIMGFADMNKWFLSYAEPKNALEQGINEHTEEDRTHSRLFYDNWYTLNLRATSHWRPGKTLWWLFASSDSSAVRRFGMEILDLAVNYHDPLVRFPMMEAIELCGDVFFANTAPIATRLSEKHGVNHVYFGEYHRARETGHLHTDETVFARPELSAEQRRDCELVVGRVFDRFADVLDEILSYAQRAVADHGAHQRDLEDEYLTALTPPGTGSSPPPARRSPSAVVESATQFPIIRHLHRRMERLGCHAFFDWLRSDDEPELERLQSFVALWGIDVVGYSDFAELVLRYPAPASAAERSINDWTVQLATHGALYLQDWNALEMDRFLRWDMGQTVAFYFLSHQTETHRRNMAKVKQHAFSHKEPMLRYWLMRAIESSREVLLGSTAPVAQAIEEDQGVLLNYWANRRELAHPVRELSRADEFVFTAEHISLSERKIAIQIIDTVFDNMEEQLALSLGEASSGVFLRAPATLPPPRMSDAVLRATG